MGSIARRYAPLKRDHIPGFPNQIPKVNWKINFPMFKDEDGDYVALHLVRFHMHARKLKVQFHEYCLLKMFMDSLERKAWSWYEGFPPASIHSLGVFH